MNPRLWQWVTDALSGIGALVLVVIALWVMGRINFA